VRSERPVWIEVALALPRGWEDAIGVFLIETLGVHGVVEEAAPPDAAASGLKFYLRADASFETTLNRLAAHLAALGLSEARLLSCVRLPETHWQTAWQKVSVPLQQIGQRLLVKAPWHEVDALHERVVVEINPAMAFGTGTHPTTRNCLMYLEELLPLDAPPSVALLDVGCGSGILSIAAVKLGAAEAIAVDSDPEALAAARANIEANGVAHRVRLSPRLPPRARFEVVVANITLTPLLELAGPLSAAVAPAGHLILSGLLSDQEAETLERYAGEGLRIVSRRLEADWVTLLLTPA
jgi:ribosomal protein L11 methyltransferase